MPPARPPTAIAPAPPPDTAAPAGGAPPRPARLGWLDALRAVAALAVAFQHAAYRYVPELHWKVTQWFDPGTYGITVFFLVSGYIVPASLTRTGDVRRFWISRLFRIYPLWLIASAAIVALATANVANWRTGLPDIAPGTAVLAHVTMLQDLLSVPSVINVLWTLSYEMAFYLLIVALFTARLHTRPAAVAAGFALGAVAFGSLLPVAGLSQAAGIDVTAAVVAAAVVAAICGAMSRRPPLRTAGALLGGVLAVVLITANGRVGPWQGLSIIATMFVGTAIYQAEHRTSGRRVTAAVAALVLACTIVAGVWHSYSWGLPPSAQQAFQRGWTSAMLLAALTFALGLALRHRRLPRLLTGIGLISYSIYLLHPVLFQGLDHIVGRPSHDNPGMLTAALAVLLLISWAGYRLIEAPAQRLGRALAHRRRVPDPPSRPTAP